MCATAVIHMTLSIYSSATSFLLNRPAPLRLNYNEGVIKDSCPDFS